MASTMGFNLIGKENAIIPNIILHTLQDMENMLKELKIVAKSPMDYLGIRDFYSYFNVNKKLDDAMQCSILDSEIVADEQFMESISENFSQCKAINAKINQNLDKLDEIMSKSMDIPSYTDDELAIVIQTQSIYEKLHSTLQSILIDTASENSSNSNQVIECDIITLINCINPEINSNKYGNSIRTRRRIYMRWIGSLKECMDSIQNLIDTNTQDSTAQSSTSQPNQTQPNTQEPSIQEQDEDKESNENIPEHQINPFL